jgi:hypothetical protein
VGWWFDGSMEMPTSSKLPIPIVLRRFLKNWQNAKFLKIATIGIAVDGTVQKVHEMAKRFPTLIFIGSDPPQSIVGLSCLLERQREVPY